MPVPLCCVRGVVYTVRHFVYTRCSIKNKVHAVMRRLMTGDTFLEMHR